MFIRVCVYEMYIYLNKSKQQIVIIIMNEEKKRLYNIILGFSGSFHYFIKDDGGLFR